VAHTMAERFYTLCSTYCHVCLYLYV